MGEGDIKNSVHNYPIGNKDHELCLRMLTNLHKNHLMTKSI